MLIPKGPHRTFKKKTTKKGVPRQSAYTLSTRERRRALKRQGRQATTLKSTEPQIEKTDVAKRDPLGNNVLSTDGVR